MNTEIRSLNRVQDWFAQYCYQAGSEFKFSLDQSYRLNLAITEGFTNAVRHAHATLPPETPIQVQVTRYDDRWEVRIWDYGRPFDPTKIPEPQPGTLQRGGYGWFLLRRLVDRVHYERICERNCLVLVKYFAAIPAI